MKEIVLVLELAAENDWIDAFYLPFGQNEAFKPVMGSCTQALTCLMNIRISFKGVDIFVIFRLSEISQKKISYKIL